MHKGKSSESVQFAMLKACDACADMGQLQPVAVLGFTIFFWGGEQWSGYNCSWGARTYIATVNHP